MQVDTDGFRRRVERLNRAVPRILRTVGEEMQYAFQAFAEEHFEERPGDGPNTGKKLRVQSGDLTRSLIPGQGGSLSRLDVTGDGLLSLRVGTSLPYGKLHETGGFIKSKGKMDSFFWAKYYETSNDFFKFAALAVQRDGGITIPARPWFEPAKREMMKTGRRIAERRLRKEIAAAFA